MSDITISKSFYNSLIAESKKLQCLEESGIDNWEGYEESMIEYTEWVEREGTGGA